MEIGNGNHRNQFNSVLRVLFGITQLMNTFGYIANAQNWTTAFSLVSRAYILLNVASFVLYLVGRQTKFEARQMGLLVAMAVTTAAAYLLHPGSGLYQFILMLCAYLSLPMYMMYMPSMRHTRWVLNCVTFSSVATALFFVIRFFAAPDYYAGNLTLGYFNANTAGVFLMQNVAVLLTLFYRQRRQSSGLLIFALAALETYILFRTHCRAAIICVIVGWFVFFIRVRRFPKWVVNLFVIAPMVFVLVLELVYANGWLANAELFGKPLFTGRENYYLSTFQYIRQYPLLGYFAVFGLGNTHNAYLSVLASVGFIGFIPFCAFFYRFLHRSRPQTVTRTQKMAYIGLLMLFMEGCAETAVILSGSMFSAACSSLILLLYADAPQRQELSADAPEREEEPS